jgi:class 3 adenylate cyclase
METVAQPRGTVTLVFTDIEGSTRLLAELGEVRYMEALSTHREVVRAAFGEYHGYEVDTEGDSFFYAFPRRVGCFVDSQRTPAHRSSTLTRAGPSTMIFAGVHRLFPRSTSVIARGA